MKFLVPTGVFVRSRDGEQMASACLIPILRHEKGGVMVCVSMIVCVCVLMWEVEHKNNIFSLVNDDFEYCFTFASLHPHSCSGCLC